MAFVLSSCGSQSLDDYREDSSKITRQLIKELQDIKSPEQLRSRSPTLERLFFELATVMVAAQNAQFKNPETSPMPLSPQEQILSDRLRLELVRLYSLQGGRALIEQCQAKAAAVLQESLAH